jgi:adenosylmethionine-8-amino-7-oxononanoate aminotransferase
MATTGLSGREDASASGVKGGPTRETPLWHSQAHMPTVKAAERVIVRGDGAYIWDEDDNRLLDAPASLWYCNVGHGREEIAEAAAAQMETLEAYSNFQQYVTRPSLDLAERVVDLVPVKNAKVYFTSGGSDAVDLTAKLVRRHWHAVGKPTKLTIISRDNGYHGLHTFGTSMAGIPFNREGYGSLVDDVAQVPTNDVAAFQALINERGADEIAAFFCEPIVGTGGIIHPAPGYLAAIQELCRANDIFFVVDEVITGFGRTGELFASQRFDLQPDILLVAKGITSGYMPLGAAIISERVWAPFWEEGTDLIFHHGLTYSGHATACAVAMANIDIVEREQLVERVRTLEEPLAAALTPLESHDLVKEVRSGIGLLAAIQFHDPKKAEEAAAACVQRGVLGRTITGGALHISPPFVIDEKDIDFLATVISEALDSVSAQ